MSKAGVKWSSDLKLPKKDKVRKEAGKALYLVGELWMAEGVKPRTPVDTGALRSSLFVDGPDFTSKVIEVSLNAGGPSAPYAWFVHENLDAHHDVGQAKYMESYIFERGPFLIQDFNQFFDLGATI